MSFYNDSILPHVIDLAMRNRELLPYRERVVSLRLLDNLERRLMQPFQNNHCIINALHATSYVI